MALGSQFTSGHFQGLDNSGEVVPYGKLYFNDSFTGEPIYTYKDSGLTVLNTHPVVLSSSGKAGIFINSNQYDVVLKDQNDITIWSLEGFTPAGLGIDPTSWREKTVATELSQTDFIFSKTVDSATIIFVNGILKEHGATEDYISVPPYTIKFNAGLAINDEVVAFGAAPSTSVSTMYADGSVPMDDEYSPAIGQDIATKYYTDTADNQKLNLSGGTVTGQIKGITPEAAEDLTRKDYVDTKAPIISPALEGTPTAPTPLAEDNSTQIATTGFVNSKITNDVGVANSNVVKTALNAAGDAPIYACRAWVNFNGIGTVAIRGSGNVSSITDNGTGKYAVNFTTAMQDVNFSVAASYNKNNSHNPSGNDGGIGCYNFATTSISVLISDSDSALTDAEIICLQIFR